MDHLNGHTKDVNIIGFNTQGAKSNVPYITKLILDYDVIYLSEHWLSNAEKSIIENLIQPQHKLLFSSAEKKIMGRPYGGNCFIINESVAGTGTIIHEDNNILAIKVIKNDKTFIYIGV